jgi:hypothetical protein
VHGAERGEGERDRMRERERRDRPHQHAQTPNNQHQRKHEQQVVVAEQDVLDAVRNVRPGDSERPCTGHDFNPWLRRTDQRRRVLTAEQLHTYQDVGDRGLQSREFDALARKPAGYLDHATLDQRIVEIADRRLDDAAGLGGQPQRHGQPHPREHRGTPQHVVTVVPDLIDFEIRWTRLVREGGDHAARPAQREQESACRPSERADHGFPPEGGAETCGSTMS